MPDLITEIRKIRELDLSVREMRRQWAAIQNKSVLEDLFGVRPPVGDGEGQDYLCLLQGDPFHKTLLLPV